MTIAAHCPNPSCGRVSQLGDDPLGRIFRCPRCLAKLPAGGSSNGDSGWTQVLGPLPRRAPRLGAAADGREPAIATSREAFIHGFDNGEFLSGEFVVPPFDDDPDDSADSRYMLAAAAPTPDAVLASLPAPGLTAVVKAPGARTSNDLQLAARAESRGLGRFRIVGLLGEGRHATVYRASDPTLEREVALKLLRTGAPRSARAFERFLGEARVLARLSTPGSSRCTRRVATAISFTSRWP